MTDYLIADRYAGALSAALPDDDRLESVLASLREISDLFDAHRPSRFICASRCWTRSCAVSMPRSWSCVLCIS